MGVYLVGGYLRDKELAKLGRAVRPSKDVDFAVEISSYEEMKAWLVDGGYEIKCEEPQYFRIKARPPKGHPYEKYVADYLLCRKDGYYSDGRRPDSVEVCDIITDLSRRDFTVNSMGLNIDTGELLDPYKGMADIKSGTLRCVGDVVERMTEDSLRILRAIRFCVVKDFVPDYTLYEFLNSLLAMNLLMTVNQERARAELDQAFRCNTAKTIACLELIPGSIAWLFGKDSAMWLKPTTEK